VTEMDPRLWEATKPTRRFAFHSDTGNRTVLDAAQVPPSVFAAHHGEPQILHDGHDDHSRRHSTTTHQERFSGV